MPSVSFEVFSENTPGVLYRIAGVFVKRKINIEELHVAETAIEGVSRFQIRVSVETDVAEKIAKQLHKIIEVSQVMILNK